MVMLDPQGDPLEVTGLKKKKTPKTEFPQESTNGGLGWHTELSQRGSKSVLLPTDTCASGPWDSRLIGTARVC